MSLSDYVRYLRAAKGGLTPWEIAEGSGVPARDIHLLEVKHRRIGEDDTILEKLAAYFGVPVEDLVARREAYRKRLTLFAEEAEQASHAIVLKLEGGEELQGTVAWLSREAIAITPQTGEADPNSDAPYIVERSWIADWRRADSEGWEIAGR